MHHLIESRRAEIRALAEQHGFREARVFGSMVRNDPEAGQRGLRRPREPDRGLLK
jgi:predicted nucleotidyltransferase